MPGLYAGNAASLCLGALSSFFLSAVPVLAGPLSQAAAIIDASPSGPPLANEACALLSDTLGPGKSVGAANQSNALGLGGAPVTCERRYATPDGETLVSVYTSPQFVARVASGPTMPGAAAKARVNGMDVYLQDAAVTGLPGVVVSMAPSAVVVFAVDNREGTTNSAVKMVKALDTNAFKTATPASGGGANSEAQLRSFAQDIEAATVRLLGNTVSALDINIDPLGTAPRCLDVGDLLEKHPDFLYASVVVGKACVDTTTLASPAGTARVGGFSVVFDVTEQGFSGSETTRGSVRLAPYAILEFHGEGDQKAVLAALEKLDFSILAALL